MKRIPATHTFVLALYFPFWEKLIIVNQQVTRAVSCAKAEVLVFPNGVKKDLRAVFNS